MLNIFFIYILVNFLFFYAGKGVLICSEKLTSTKFQPNGLLLGIRQSTFYSLLFLFLIGNLSFILNFFYPLNYFFLIIPSVFFSLIGLVSFRDENIKVFEILIYIVTFFTFFGITAGEDFWLYHLNVIDMLKGEKILLGAALLNKRYGYSSIYEYISNYFLFNDNIIFLHIVFVLVVNFFFVFIYNLINSENYRYQYIGLTLIFIGILDNFGLSGGKNSFIDIENIGKFDSAFAIVFVVTFILLFENHLNNISKQEIFILSALLLFGFQLKHTGVIMIFFALLVFPKFLVSFLQNYRLSTIFIILGTLWMVKNVMLSSCLIFPIEISCLENLQWHVTNYAQNEQNVVRESLGAFSIDKPFVESFINWKNKNTRNYEVFLNSFLTLFIIFLIQYIFLKPKFKSKNHIVKGFITFIIFSSYIFFNVPSARFSFGILMCLTLLNFYFLNFKYINIDKRIAIFLFSISLLLYPRLASYQSFINSELNYEIVIPEVEYIKRENSFGFISKNGTEACWGNYFCTTPEAIDVELKNYYSYKMFVKYNK